MDELVDVLREQLRQAQERERRYEAREHAHQEHIVHLTTMLDQAHQQNQRLLEAPRSALPSSASVLHTQRETAPAAVPVSGTPTGTRGEMRRRILTLLQEYPEGLTPTEWRILLRANKRLSHTYLAMLQAGLRRRVGRGRDVAVCEATCRSGTQHAGEL